MRHADGCQLGFVHGCEHGIGLDGIDALDVAVIALVERDGEDAAPGTQVEAADENLVSA